MSLYSHNETSFAMSTLRYGAILSSLAMSGLAFSVAPLYSIKK